MPGAMNSINKIPLQPQSTVAINFQFKVFKFPGVVWRMSVYPLLELVLCLCINQMNPHFVSSHDSFKKFNPLLLVAQKECLIWVNSYFCEHQSVLLVPTTHRTRGNQSLLDHLKRATPQIWRNASERSEIVKWHFFTHNLVRFFNKFIGHNYVSSLSLSSCTFVHSPWMSCTNPSQNCHS